MEFLILLVWGGGLLALGLVVGSVQERRHLADLARREAATSSIVVLSTKSVPPTFTVRQGTLVMGEAVIASDYYKTFAAAIRNILGGEVKAYQSMLNRARREAKLRMVEQADGLGAEMVINVRFQWSDVGPRMPSTEMFCYGTAIVRSSDTVPNPRGLDVALTSDRAIAGRGGLPV